MATTMIDADTRPGLNAANTAAVFDRLREGPRAPQTRTLSPQALAVADQAMARPISPIVLAGIVRMAEFALIVAVGIAIVVAYIEPLGPQWLRYLVAIVVIAGLSTLAFQTADIYQVHAFRGHEKQYMRLASAWSVVFLIVIGASFFLKAGEMYSRLWLGAFFVCGLAALIVSRKLLYYAVRKWTREGRLTRRTVIVGGGEQGERVINELHRQKDTGIEIIGWFDDRTGDLLVAEDLSVGQLDPPTFPLPEHPTGHGHPSRLCCSPHPTLGSTRSCQTSHRYSCSSASGHPMSARRQSQTCPAQATRQESEWGGVGMGWGERRASAFTVVPRVVVGAGGCGRGREEADGGGG